MKEEYWTTKDGRRIAVGDMDVDHLRNTLRMIIREGLLISALPEDYTDDFRQGFGEHEEFYKW